MCGGGRITIRVCEGLLLVCVGVDGLLLVCEGLLYISVCVWGELL